jgi:hypothetical protein
MKLAPTVLLVASFLVVPLAARADSADKKPAKAEAAAMKPAGKEVTLTGTYGCAKCSFKDKEAKACQNVFKVKEGGKEVSYEVAQNQVAKDHHDAICHSPPKPATVKGTVSKEDGKRTLTASEITFN